MHTILSLLLSAVLPNLRDRAALRLELIALRHRLLVLERKRTIRRECLDHVIVLNARHLRRILSSYFDYYHRSRTHLSLAKDCPDPRPACPPGAGKIVVFPQVGGLHHRYQRLAA